MGRGGSGCEVEGKTALCSCEQSGGRVSFDQCVGGQGWEFGEVV